MLDMIVSTLSRQLVRPFIVDGQAWFSLNDSLAAFGVSRRTIDRHRDYLPDSEVMHVTRGYLRPMFAGTPTGNAGMTLVSLPGLLRIILRADSPEARQFQDWACGKVLPAVLTEGGYTEPPRIVLHPKPEGPAPATS